jgi:hypothetical protein
VIKCYLYQHTVFVLTLAGKPLFVLWLSLQASHGSSGEKASGELTKRYQFG